MQIATKNEQRKFYKSLRKDLSSVEKDKFDLGIYENVRKFILKNSDKKYLIYVSNGFEVDTFKIIKFLFEENICVYAPKCEKNDNVMNFYKINSFEDLEKGNFGILEPKKTSDKLLEFSNSVCLVPAICFDKQGFRIGFGKGFYDRFFSEHMGIFKLGLCYEKFIIDRIFKDDNDISVDLIITENCEKYIQERELLWTIKITSLIRF